MYEARQNKEKVSRRIEGGGMRKQSWMSKEVKNKYIQKKGTLKDGDSSRTNQIETKGTPWHLQTGNRDSNLSQMVDLLKKQMLTYIANKIKETATEKDLGPHIAVSISNNTWYISVNKIQDEDEIEEELVVIKTHADSIKNFVNSLWKIAKTKYNNDFYPFMSAGLFDEYKQTEEEIKEEALYICLRWAANCQIECIKPTEGHGEMSILKHIFSDSHYPTDRQGVIRVGGTLTPCFDCAWEMGVISDGEMTDIQKKALVINKIHKDQPLHKQIGNRHVTTMNKYYGPAFKNWEINFDNSKKRLSCNKKIGYKKQKQDCEVLLNCIKKLESNSN